MDHRSPHCPAASVLCLVTAIAACGGDRGPTDGLVIRYSDVRDTLTGDLVVSSPAIGIPSRIVATNSLLWVSDYAGDPELHVVDAGNGEVLASLGRRGEAGGEFRGRISGMQVFPPDTTALWTFDPNGQRLIRVQFGVGSNEWTTIQLTGSPYIARVTWLDLNTIVGITGIEEARFSIFTSSGERVTSVPGVFLGSEEVPIDEKAQATVTGFDLCTRPDGTNVALYYRNFGRIELFDENLTDQTLVQVPFPSGPMFTPDEGGRMTFTKYRSHYLDCAAEENRFYMLYSGSPLDWDEALFATADAGHYVHVFDWDGRLQDVLYLATPMHGISVLEDVGWLYGVSFLDEGGVYRFRLPIPGS